MSFIFFEIGMDNEFYCYSSMSFIAIFPSTSHG
jgi:hypothetical protein